MFRSVNMRMDKARLCPSAQGTVQQNTRACLTACTCQEWLSHLFAFPLFPFNVPSPWTRLFHPCLCTGSDTLIQIVHSERMCWIFFFLLTFLCWFSEFNQLSEQPGWKSWYETTESVGWGAEPALSGSSGPLVQLYSWTALSEIMTLENSCDKIIKVFPERSLGTWILGFHFLLILLLLMFKHTESLCKVFEMCCRFRAFLQRHINICLLGNSKPQPGNKLITSINSNSLEPTLWHFFGKCKPGVKLDYHP